MQKFIYFIERFLLLKMVSIAGKAISILTIVFCLTPMIFSQAGPLDRTPPKYPEKGRGGNTELRDPSANDKLAPELQILSEQFTVSRGRDSAGNNEDAAGGYTPQQLREIFGLENVNSESPVSLSIEVVPGTKNGLLTNAGAKIFFRNENLIYLNARISILAQLANISAVKRIGLLKSMNIPKAPVSKTAPSLELPARGSAQTTPPKNKFNKQGLTGKGVIVGVIDSGIDWTHPDFIREDGTSRILMIWDVTDDSWKNSNGKIGTAPPILGQNNEQLPGTIYSNAQINAALKNQSKINSADRVGHGTAVAGTAAGNGRGAANGTLPADFEGIAPDADLIVVKVGDCNESSSELAAIGAYWTAATAKGLKRPAVINISLGTQYTNHDGNNDEEKLLNNISDTAKGFGTPIVVAAGNEGRLSIHAGDRFGPRKPEQIDIASQPIEVNVSQPSMLMGTFAGNDDWGLVFRSTNPAFLGTDNHPVSIYLYKAGGKVNVESDSQPANEKQFKQFLQTVRQTTQDTTDSLMMQIGAGQYIFFGYGASGNVTNGQFDLFLPDQQGASFGTGTEKKFMVSSPGNAAKVITVGSSDFRSEWENAGGQISRFNLQNGDISDYSSPGPRRDGVTKPEIVAPGRYVIASLSKFSIPENGGCQSSMVAEAAQQKIFITKSSHHLAWSGTSAAAPFVTGVIALMLQKNPSLNAEQIKQTLIKTAAGRTRNGQAVNDQRLGYGNIEPEAALKSITLPSKTVTVRKKR